MLVPHTAACLTLAVPPRMGATLPMPSLLLPGRPSWSPVRAIAPIPAIDILTRMTVIITTITIPVDGASTSSRPGERAESTTFHTTEDMDSLSTEAWAGMAARTELGMAVDMAMVDIVSILPSRVALSVEFTTVRCFRYPERFLADNLYYMYSYLCMYSSRNVL